MTSLVYDVTLCVCDVTAHLGLLHLFEREGARLVVDHLHQLHPAEAADSECGDHCQVGQLHIGELTVDPGGRKLTGKLKKLTGKFRKLTGKLRKLTGKLRKLTG